MYFKIPIKKTQEIEEIEEFEKIIITRSNIDKKLDLYAHILSILVEIKKQYDKDDDDEIDISDAESLMSMSDDE